MYGDRSAKTASMLTIEDVNGIENEWDDCVDIITEYYFANYKDWKIVRIENNKTIKFPI